MYVYFRGEQNIRQEGFAEEHFLRVTFFKLEKIKSKYKQPPKKWSVLSVIMSRSNSTACQSCLRINPQRAIWWLPYLLFAPSGCFLSENRRARVRQNFHQIGQRSLMNFTSHSLMKLIWSDYTKVFRLRQTQASDIKMLLGWVLCIRFLKELVFAQVGLCLCAMAYLNSMVQLQDHA